MPADVLFHFSAWLEPWFQEIYQRAANHTVVTPDRAYMLYQFARQVTPLEGDFAECGVYKGGTAYVIAHAMREYQTQGHLHLFDTFAGMPSTADEDASLHKAGDFGDTSLEAVKQVVSEFPFVEFHPGFIPATFAGLEDRRFAFAHIDVDLYESVRDCCQFFYDRMVRGGVLIFDDYGFPHYIEAAKRAADEFFANKPEPLISLRTGQCLVFKQ